MGSKLKKSLVLLTFAIMYKLVLAAVLAVAAAAPVEDTAEVAAAKASFKAAFDIAEAGDHAALAPVNNDVQAAQIANAYLDDTVDVAEAKAAFDAEFKSVAAGGLAAKQAPAPVHEVAEPMKVAAVPFAPVTYAHAIPAYHHVYPQVYSNVLAHHAAYPYAAFNYAHYPYTYGVHYPMVVPAAAPVKDME